MLSTLPFHIDILYNLCFFLMHVFKLCVSHGLSLSLFRETLTNGKQVSNLILTVIIFLYQSAPLMYNAPQSSDSIRSINLWQFRSPNILIFGLSCITWALCGFKDMKKGRWSLISQYSRPQTTSLTRAGLFLIGLIKTWSMHVEEKVVILVGNVIYGK